MGGMGMIGPGAMHGSSDPGDGFDTLSIPGSLADRTKSHPTRSVILDPKYGDCGVAPPKNSHKIT
jgi:hypothetical protein